MMFDKFKQLAELRKIQKELSKEEVVVEEKGIRVVVGGDQRIKEITIDGELRQDLVEVLNKAIQSAQLAAARKIQGMGGGLMGMLGK